MSRPRRPLLIVSFLLVLMTLSTIAVVAAVEKGQAGPRPKPTRSPKPTPTATATPAPTPPPAGSVILVGAGDIADCSATTDDATAALLDGIAGTVFVAGDNAYEDGSTGDYANCYDPTWGRQKARTRPVPGNHEYQTAGAAGYFGYFGAAAGDPTRGYYAYDLGSWRIYALNSNCAAIGGCGAGSAEETWLRSDLAANPRACTLAVWHHPLFSSGYHGNDASTAALWQALVNAGAEIVVVGHDHDYERFAPQTATGAPSSTGITEYVVGTGGRALRGFSTIRANSLVRSAATFGVIKFTLGATGWSFSFVPIAGQSWTDAGSGTCH